MRIASTQKKLASSRHSLITTAANLQEISCRQAIASSVAVNPKRIF